ncbi:MAG: gliding motility-associated C-terminal domain-containing protein [Saprospiraceae bacterium]
MNSLKSINLIVGCCLTIVSFSQNSFVQIMDQVETWPNSCVADTPDQGFVMANELEKPFSEGGKHGFFVVKYDSCAQVEWSRLYESDNFGLFLEDLTVSPAGDILATGSTGLQDVFLLKIDLAGEIHWLHAYDASNYDRSYAIDVFEDQIMLFGNYLDNVESRNYVLVTDMDGNIRWSKRYALQEGEGSAVFGMEGSILCRNGHTLYEVDANGNPLWAKQYSDAELTSHPIAMENGFAITFTASEAGQQFVAKIGQAGGMEWQSEALPAAYEQSDLALSPKGELVYVNSLASTAGEVTMSLPMITLLSDKGSVKAQYLFELGDFGRFIDPACTVNAENGITLKGKYENEFSYDYVLRITPDTALNCVGLPFAETYAQAPPVKQSPFNVTAATMTFQRIDTFHIAYQDIDLNSWAFCGNTRGEEFLAIDSLVACADTFLFTSPYEEASYVWKDGSTAAVRMLKAPGKYQVDVITCNKTYHYDIKLDLGKCPCPLFVPNAFSPNGDGMNDQLELYASCLFRDFDLKIFNRWGELLYQANGPEVYWDGTSKGKRLPSGVYVYAIDYSWEIYPGHLRQEIATGTVALVR